MMDAPREGLPWWEFDPSEKPVPLGPEGEWAAADDAELIVNSEREAIAREDTDPSIQTLTYAASMRATRAARVIRRSAGPSRLTFVVAIALLAAGCIGMFALGWSQGSASRDLGHRPNAVGSSSSPATIPGPVNQVTGALPPTAFALIGSEARRSRKEGGAGP